MAKRYLFYNFLIWTIVAIFTATQLYLKTLQEGQAAKWLGIFFIQLAVWWIWGIITPLVFWLGKRFRVDRSNMGNALLIHLPVAVLIVLVYLGIYTTVWSLATFGTLSLEGLISIYKILFTNLFHWHFFIYMAIIGVVHAQSYYQESQEKAIRGIHLEKQLLQSQLNALKMQVQPHFLFNSLNSVVSSIHQGKTDTAVDMLTELSDLFRQSLNDIDRQLIPLSDELEYVKSYLQMEQYRFKDLKIQYDVPDDLLQEEVPNFILQPIIENAIKHGISRRKDAKLIRISALREEQALIIEVENEGPKFQIKNEGVGLSNIKNRLSALYGEHGTIDITSSILGTKVLVEIPTL
ncbi:MAG: histidine kinase [Bacteroidota bacterium]